MVNKFKAFMASALSVCGFPLLAAEGDFDVSIASQFLTKASSAITTFWTDNQATILTILGIIVGLSVLWMIVKIFRKATSKAG